MHSSEWSAVQCTSGGTDALWLGVQITLPECSTWLYFITLRDLQPLFNISKPQFPWVQNGDNNCGSVFIRLL